jgi:deoxyribodipyrimidine photo-lyase
MINEKRVRLLQDGSETDGPVIYWMSRDQRVHDNWALLFAQKIAIEKRRPLAVLFSLQSNFLSAAVRQYGFMIKGLREVESELARFNIPFFILIGKPKETLPNFLKEINASFLISDFDPLRIKRIWKRDTAKKISIPFCEVDAHNIVPCLKASNKAEFGAYTIRPKIQKLLPEFLDEFPEIKKMKTHDIFPQKNDWDSIVKNLKIDLSVKEVDWIKPGQKAAYKKLNDFLEKKIENYAADRNDPVKDGQSNLSPYLHFGQLSAQRIVLNIQKLNLNSESVKSFLEELIIRRELSDNFCYFNKKYDSFEGFPQWAQNSLNAHRKDEREFIYSLKQFENSETHEDLWNAAQKELTSSGKMHGYMRMYWAKKILEWSSSPEEALKISIFLNDKYELDGRDPNGYTGCAWSIGGVHDRAWAERPVFGKIRYMNRNGAARKFDIKAYIKKHLKYSI